MMLVQARSCLYSIVFLLCSAHGLCRSTSEVELVKPRSIGCEHSSILPEDSNHPVAHHRNLLAKDDHELACLKEDGMIPNGHLLTASDVVNSFDECCTLCQTYNHSTGDSCNTFAFCPAAEGCYNPSTKKNYNQGACLLISQQELQVSGNTINPRTFDVSYNISFIAGAPVQVPLEDVAGYQLYAYGTLPTKVADFNCSESEVANQCQLHGYNITAVADLCDVYKPHCYGFVWLPYGNSTVDGPVAILKGGNTTRGYAQYLLYVGNFLSLSPTAQLYTLDVPLPTPAEFDVAYWIIPAYNMSLNIRPDSGCLIEYHTVYRGAMQRTLYNVSSAVGCCKACDRLERCNSYNFCPFPIGCNFTEANGEVIEYPGNTCRLLNQDVVANGKYPAVAKQDPAEKWTSGLPTKIAKLMKTMFETTDRPNPRQEQSANCTLRKNYLYTGLIIKDGEDNRQETVDACCESCRAHPVCNIWAYCPMTEVNGCVHVYRNKTYLPGSCRLKHFSTVSISSQPAMYVGEGTALAPLGVGPNITWISGAPIRAENKSVDGYNLLKFADMPLLANINCSDANIAEGMVPGGCRYENLGLQDVAEKCNNNDDCEGFVWYPYGDGLNDASYSRPVAYLKGSEPDENFVEIIESNSTVNPSAAIYVQNALLGITSPSTEEGGADLGLILGLSLGIGIPLLLLLVCVAAMLVIRRPKYSDTEPPLSIILKNAAEERKKSGPDSHKSNPSTAYEGDYEIKNNGKGAPSSNGSPPISSGTKSSRGNTGSSLTSPPDSGKRRSNDSDPISPNPSSEFGGWTSGTSNPGMNKQGSGNFADVYDWEVLPDELEICKDLKGRDNVLGKGAYGTVYKAKFRGGTFVAVKELKFDAHAEDNHHHIVKEISILRSVRSPNVVQFMGACQLSDRFLLVTEFMEGGTLWEALQKGRVTWWNRGAHIALDTAQGLHFLHSRRVLHLDLKSANILLDRHLRGKVSDVGLSQVLQGSYVKSLALSGTFAWMAPEVLMAAKVSTKADVFSFGVLLWEIVTGEEPARGQLRNPNVPTECSAEVAKLIKDCTLSDPDDRPNMEVVIDILREQAKQVIAQKLSSRSAK